MGSIDEIRPIGRSDTTGRPTFSPMSGPAFLPSRDRNVKEARQTPCFSEAYSPTAPGRRNPLVFRFTDLRPEHAKLSQMSLAVYRLGFTGRNLLFLLNTRFSRFSPPEARHGG